MLTTKTLLCMQAINHQTEIKKERRIRKKNIRLMFGSQKIWGKCKGKKEEKDIRRKDNWRKIKNRFKVNKLFLKAATWNSFHFSSI